ncbi:unnamed protein product [Nippostrongylus brasiliensis]|uniref:PAS domain-containing protein n=1 Tax=Nippostrongylus brasiliensis TaxID=27835 RepID=A0A0N4XP43_NIPBR|nr:unnamed protein product [Nippostrongylus brasiliensis]
MMMLIDQIPSKIVDGHGFRSLMSFLLPEYPMPSAELFESTICPEVITQIQPHLASLFSANKPVLTRCHPRTDDKMLVNGRRLVVRVTFEKFDVSHESFNCRFV